MTTDLLYSPRIDAFVHSEGVVLGKFYIPLEVTYCDRTGVFKTFLVTSPLGYGDAKSKFPKFRQPDAIMTVRGGTPYPVVLEFLRLRYRILSARSAERITFGYKGGSFQPNLLRDAQIPFVFNVERWNCIPSIAKLAEKFRDSIPRGDCPHHIRSNRDKCSEWVTRLVMAQMS